MGKRRRIHLSERDLEYRGFRKRPGGVVEPNTREKRGERIRSLKREFNKRGQEVDVKFVNRKRNQADTWVRGYKKGTKPKGPKKASKPKSKSRAATFDTKPGHGRPIFPKGKSFEWLRKNVPVADRISRRSMRLRGRKK